MTTSIVTSPVGQPRVPSAADAARAAPSSVTWPLACAVASSLTVAFGTHWDIAWHRSIGRDAFWSPPHVAIYAAAVLAATAALAQILPATFARGRAGAPGGPPRAVVHVLGFRGPLGAFISAWGGVAMLSSAPFDDWWHNAYGLDVKILSPPHFVLALGIIALHIGALVMLAGARNRSAGAVRRAPELLELLVGAMVLVALMELFMEKTLRVHMHLGSFYLIVGVCASLVLTASRVATERRWAATTAAAIYSAFLLALLWTFPLVPAQPKLGPVLVPTSCLVPPEFPLLLLPAAAALDAWLWRRRSRPGFVTAAIGGALIVLVFFVCQWPFASFLMSPAARNFFWGARYFDFWMPPDFLYRRYEFIPEAMSAVARGLASAVVGAALAGAAGGAIGRWLGRIKR